VSFFQVKPPDKIASRILVEREEETFLIVALFGRKIGIQAVLGITGPVWIQRFMDLSNIFPTSSCYISHCKENGLIFIGCGKNSLCVTKVEHLFSDLRHENWGLIKTASQERLVFACMHPQIPSLYFFQTAANGPLEMIEFTDAGVVCSIPDVPRCPSLGFQDPAVLGVIQTENSVAYIGYDGIVYTLKAGGSVGDLLLQFESGGNAVHGEEEDGFRFTVPATFWTSASL
jgi:hypothetical protein